MFNRCGLGVFRSHGRCLCRTGWPGLFDQPRMDLEGTGLLDFPVDQRVRAGGTGSEQRAKQKSWRGREAHDFYIGKVCKLA